jgi:hypothetical protein
VAGSVVLAVTDMVITPLCVPRLIAVNAALTVVYAVGPKVPAVAVTETCAWAAMILSIIIQAIIHLRLIDSNLFECACMPLLKTLLIAAVLMALPKDVRRAVGRGVIMFIFDCFLKKEKRAKYL